MPLGMTPAIQPWSSRSATKRRSPWRSTSSRTDLRPAFFASSILSTDLAGVLHLFLRHLDDDVAGAAALLGRRRCPRDVDDDDARRVVGEREALAQIRRQMSASDRPSVFTVAGGRPAAAAWLGRQRGLLLALVELADLDVERRLPCACARP